jgi:Glycosyl hydrolase family 26
MTTRPRTATPQDASALPVGRNDRRRATTSEWTRRLVTGLAVGAAVASVTVAGMATAATGVSAPRSAGASLAKPAVPQNGTYLGAFVVPHLGENQAQADVRQELAQLGNFDGAIGRSLGLVHVYQPWSTPVRTSTLAALAATGATPFVDWTCTSDASVINGNQDALITSYADSLKTYGHPVFLRWFWEMNLVNLPRTSGCLGTLGSAGYVQAWQHIWTIFQNEGATNVSFVWCPSINGPAFGSAYYPGNAYVDWIGWDGYDRTQSPSATLTQFQPYYAYWAAHASKPLVIGETGATADQAAYLAALTTALPSTMPHVHAVLYYDSKSSSDWTLVDTPGNLGADQFSDLAQTPYFGFPFVGS